MTQLNTLNAKSSNSQLNELKFEIKIGTEVTLNLSSNFIVNSNDKTNFPHQLLLTDTQVSKLRKVFPNSSTANIKFSKTQFCKIQSGGFSILNLMNLAEVAYEIANNAKKLSNKVSFDDISKNILPDSKNILSDPTRKFGMRITLTNNETKDILKVVK